MTHKKIGKFSIDYLTSDIFEFIEAYVFSDSSEYSFLLNKQGKSIILHKEFVAEIRINKISEQLAFKLIQRGFLIGAHHGEQIAPIKIKYFIIDITKSCNFNCLYCFRNHLTNSQMSSDTISKIAMKIIGYCRKNDIKQIGIQAFGGEPLLYLEGIKSLCKCFSNSGIEVCIDVETNASLINDAIAKELMNLNIKVGVSIDGDEKAHNAQRRLADGSKSYEMVIQGIKNLKKYYFVDFSVINVLTKMNIDRIKDLIQFYIYDLNITNVKFNIVKDNPNAVESRLAPSTVQIERFAAELCDTIFAYYRMGIRFNEDNLLTRLQNLLSRTNNNFCLSNGCRGGEAMISIDCDGNIFPCETLDFPNEKLANIFDSTFEFDSIAEKKRQHDFFVHSGAKCENCPWEYYCKGGCASRRRYNGNKEEIDEVECAINKVIYPKLIELILSEPQTVDNMSGRITCHRT
ncbi:MAG: radical SAM protein [Clostridiales bacterium]|jgi:uncharacterized protein|nr:radical SAM protein [Clostridiales bacterium]